MKRACFKAQKNICLKYNIPVFIFDPILPEVLKIPNNLFIIYLYCILCLFVCPLLASAKPELQIIIDFQWWDDLQF